MFELEGFTIFSQFFYIFKASHHEKFPYIFSPPSSNLGGLSNYQLSCGLLSMLFNCLQSPVEQAFSLALFSSILSKAEEISRFILFLCSKLSSSFSSHRRTKDLTMAHNRHQPHPHFFLPLSSYFLPYKYLAFLVFLQNMRHIPSLLPLLANPVLTSFRSSLQRHFLGKLPRLLHVQFKAWLQHLLPCFIPNTYLP